MNKIVVVLLGTLAISCSRNAPVVQSDVSSAPAPKAARDSNEREPFWSDTIRQWSTLSREWNRIPGRYGTGCAHDSVYAFKVRPGLTDKVMIFLNGGGMCWRSATCDPKKPATVMSADDPANDVSVRSGILDYNNEKNPVRDWTFVFVNYCTGDAHLGSAEVDYLQPGPKTNTKTFKIRHGGAPNLEAMMDWVYVNLKRPVTVFVAGSDAGAVASPVVAAKMAKHYPRARVVQLGDGAGAYRSDSIPMMMALWGAADYLRHDAAYRTVDSSGFTFQGLYTAASRSAPRIRFAQFNTSDDAAQLAFIASLGVKGTSIAKPLASNLAELREQVPGFRTYTAPGKTHTILRSNAFYTLKVDGTLLVDWVAALVGDGEVSSVGVLK